ncbi:MAG: D-alanine--D-alanine ligase [Culturomica sp.]|nr:D-alanine--D-alanine ligase [Culturomica sp.]
MCKKNVAVIAGGNSAEAGISLKSGEFVYANIDGDKYNKYLMIIEGREWKVEIEGNNIPVDLNDFSINYKGEKVNFDFAYITIHGIPGENGMLQGYLDMMGIPYSTSSLLCEAMTFDKFTCNNYLRSFGINTTNPIMLHKDEHYYAEGILSVVGLPCFIKPNSEGSSFGVSKVKRAEDFEQAVNEAFTKSKEILVETFIDGTEFTCGLYRAGEKKVIFPIAEIVPKKEFFDYEAKYQNMSDEIIPGRFSDEITENIQNMASDVYDILRCDGIVRIDGFVKGGEVIMLEVNTTPGMTPNSFIPQMARAMNADIKQIFTEIIEAKLR